MLHIPIEERYSLRSIRLRQEHNILPVLGAIAAIGSIGGAVAGGIMQSQSAGRAAKRQEEASRRLQQQLAQIEPPRYDVARDISESGQITDYNLRQLEQIFPGATNQRQVAARATDAMLRGEIPQDVQQQIMRSVAELGGAGFVPQAAQRPEGGPPVGGFQVPQAMLSRQLGLTSLNLQQLGQQSSQAWQKLAGAFIESPLQVGQSRLAFERAAAATKAGIAEGQYGAQTQAIGARFAADTANVQAIQGITGAISGAAMGAMSMPGIGGGAAAATTPIGSTGGPAGFLGQFATGAQYESGLRGTGLIGSVQNLFAGQLGRPALGSVLPSYTYGR